jgi:hypothetical protein
MTLWAINQTLINLIILTGSFFTLLVINITILKMIVKEFKKH